MTTITEFPDGVQLAELKQGAVIDVETQSRHYSLEYLGGDEVRVSGHPQWCPTPVVVKLEGSLGNSGAFEPGFVGPGMHLVFQRFGDRMPVTTTEVKDVHLSR
jgi:hypothetical protein